MFHFHPVFTMLLAVLLGPFTASAAPFGGYFTFQAPASGTYVEAYSGPDCAGMPTAAYYLEFINRVRNLGPAQSIRSSPENDGVVVNMFAGNDASGAQVGSITGRHCINSNGDKVNSVQLVV